MLWKFTIWLVLIISCYLFIAWVELLYKHIIQLQLMSWSCMSYSQLRLEWVVVIFGDFVGTQAEIFLLKIIIVRWEVTRERSIRYLIFFCFSICSFQVRTRKFSHAPMKTFWKYCKHFSLIQRWLMHLMHTRRLGQANRKAN
jgi:hypothetical protein